MLADALAGVEDASTRAALAQRIFGRSGTELLPLFTAGAEGLEAMRQKARDLGIVMSTEDAAAAAEFKDSLNELKGAFAGLLMPVLPAIIKRLTGLSDLLAAHPEKVGLAVIALTGLAAIIGVTKVATIAATAATTVYHAVVLIAKGSVLAYNLVLTASGRALVAQKVATIASTVATAATTVATTAQAVALGAYHLVVRALTLSTKASTVATVARTVATVAGTVATGLATIATAAFGVALRLALGPVGLIITAIGLLTAGVILLIKHWDTIWPAIQKGFQAATDFIWNAYNSKWGWILPAGPLVKAILFFRDNWNTIWDHVKAVIRSVADFILPIIDRIVSAVRSVSGAVSTVSGIAGGIGGGIASVIPGLAAGGNVRSGGAALVGERGPELVSLPRGAQVSPLDGGGGMGGITNNFYSLAAADFRREVERIINAPGAKSRAVGRP